MRQAAGILAQRARLPVAPVDVRDLARRGLLPIVMSGALMMVELDGFTAIEELHRVVKARLTWWTASMGPWDAAEALGVSLEEFDRLAAGAGLRPGRYGRYSRAKVMRFAARCAAGDETRL